MGELYYLGNSRGEQQTRHMIELEAAGRCMFCPEWLLEELGRPPLYQSDLWTVGYNDYPYQDTSLHLLIVPSEHVEALHELAPNSLAALQGALAWVVDAFHLTSYGLFARNGNPAFTGGTIKHLHLQLVVGDPNSDTPVRAKLASRPKEIPPPD